MPVTLPADAETACRALWDLGGSATSVRLSQVLPGSLAILADRRQVIDYAERQGWIARANRRIELTGKGQQRFSPYLRPREEIGAESKPAYTAPLKTFESVLSRLPIQHRLFVTLLTDTIVARRHLALSRNEPWPGYIAIGGSGTGKTTMHRLICRLFGFDPVPCTVNLTQAHTRGALKGTVIAGHGFMPSPYMRLPYLAFEEIDKEKTLISLVDPYFLGEISHETRGQPYHIFPAPAIFANPPDDIKAGRYSLVHPAWRRRSVLLDTQYMSPREKEQIEDFADWLDNPGNLSPGLLELDSFTVPGRLSDPGKAVLQCVRELLSPDFRNRDLYCGTGPLELISLGHAAVYGCSHEIAAWEVGVCYLSITDTIPGQTIPDAMSIWAKIRGYIGSDLSVLRGMIRASKPEPAQSDTGASIQANSKAEMLDSVAANTKRYAALREISEYIYLFDPDKFYLDTRVNDIACEYCDRILAVQHEIKEAKSFGKLDTALDLWRDLRGLLQHSVAYLRQELAAIEQEDSGESPTLELESEPIYELEPEPNPTIAIPDHLPKVSLPRIPLKSLLRLKSRD